MGFHENKVNQKQPVITNSSGVAYVQGELVYEQGFFGNVVNPEGIAAGETGTIDTDVDREIESDQINTAQTFAVSVTSVPALLVSLIEDKVDNSYTSEVYCLLN